MSDHPCLQQESCEVIWPESPLTHDVFPLSNFLSTDSRLPPHPPTPAPLLGYKFPIFHAVFTIEPSSILRSLFSHCNSPTKKSGFLALTIVRL